MYSVEVRNIKYIKYECGVKNLMGTFEKLFFVCKPNRVAILVMSGFFLTLRFLSLQEIWLYALCWSQLFQSEKLARSIQLKALNLQCNSITPKLKK